MDSANEPPIQYLYFINLNTDRCKGDKVGRVKRRAFLIFLKVLVSSCSKEPFLKSINERSFYDWLLLWVIQDQYEQAR